MAAFFSSRALAPVAALGVLITSATANAQVPAPSSAAAPAGPGYAPPAGYGYPPGYAPPGYGYPPPGAYAPYAPQPGWTAVVETERRSPKMMGLGIALMALGGTGIIIGSSMFAAGNHISYDAVPCFDGGDCGSFPSNDEGLKKGGIATLVVSVAAIAAGLPLTIVGAQRVPLKPAVAALLPEAHGQGLRWRF